MVVNTAHFQVPVKTAHFEVPQTRLVGVRQTSQGCKSLQVLNDHSTHALEGRLFRAHLVSGLIFGAAFAAFVRSIGAVQKARARHNRRW